ncbi:hypothetical protein [Kineococcus sp. SYSU DK018]|uniref:hypothetical protein n=1 Tax=Kineococcus sp. SYSU DK018 TaxID=3383139 RepID=UPI003D7DAD1C
MHDTETDTDTRTALLDSTDRVWAPRADGLWESTDRVITTRQLLEDAFGPTRPAAAPRP